MKEKTWFSRMFYHQDDEHFRTNLICISTRFAIVVSTVFFCLSVPQKFSGSYFTDFSTTETRIQCKSVFKCYTSYCTSLLYLRNTALMQLIPTIISLYVILQWNWTKNKASALNFAFVDVFTKLTAFFVLRKYSAAVPFCYTLDMRRYIFFTKGEIFP